MKKIVVFTGAGVSADSGLATFRDSDGLWANYRIEDVCTPEALARDRHTVIEFYNKRRREMFAAEPNDGHRAIAELERYFTVDVVTQNVDNLHERAGSSRVMHLHGELTKLCSSRNKELAFEFGGIEQPDELLAPDGSPARPYIVFFGESVPMFDAAVRLVAQADILVVAGTSLSVYPAASLVRYARPEVPVYLVDPGQPDVHGVRNLAAHIAKPGAQGLPLLTQLLIEKYR